MWPANDMVSTNIWTEAHHEGGAPSARAENSAAGQAVRLLPDKGRQPIWKREEALNPPSVKRLFYRQAKIRKRRVMHR